MDLVFFASGQGSNFKVILEKINKYKLKCKVKALITDRECNAISIAKKYNIEHKLIEPSASSYLLTYLKQLKPTYIFLAGYMSILPKEIIDAFPLKIINIHPSLLPSFKGKNAIKRAWLSGVKISGVTIHYVNYGVDLGPIIQQVSLKVSDDFLKFEKQIRKLEHKIYFETIKELIKNPFNKLLVSKCLLGENCRYNQENKYNSLVHEFFNNFKGETIKICPELDAGLTVPRDPFDYIDSSFYNKNGENINFLVYKKIYNFYLKLVKTIKKTDKVLAILKENSPSCGVKKIGFITEKLRKLKKVYIVSEKDISC